MQSLPATDDIDPITLPDGTQLDLRQTRAVVLTVTSSATPAQVAKQAGYSSKATLQTFLRSEKGRLGVSVATRQHLSHAGMIGLQTLISVAQNRKAPSRDRVSAASKLVDLAGLQPDAAATGNMLNNGGRELNISINIGQATQAQGDDAKVIDAVVIDPEVNG